MTRKEFGRYVNSEYGKLLGYLRSRVSNPEDAEDLLQQTLLKLLVICEEIDARSPHGYFFTALRTAIIDYWRKRGRQPPSVELPEQVLDPSESEYVPAFDDQAAHQVRTILVQAARELTQREAKAFAAYWKGKGSRSKALALLELREASDEDKEAKQEKYRVYDGPLCHAKKKLREVLVAQGQLLEDVGYARVWDLVYEVFCGEQPPEAA